MSMFKVYFNYISLYLGIALVGGAIVHWPNAPAKNTALVMIGLALFVFGSYIEARKGGRGQLPRYLFLSALLSIGIGMISGSIQHFDDFPGYCSVLIPCGVLLSLLAYSVREASATAKQLAITAVALAPLLLFLGFGLRQLGYAMHPGA